MANGSDYQSVTIEKKIKPYINFWWLIFIIIAILVLIGLIWWIFTRRSIIGSSAYINNNAYQLVWGDDFTKGTVVTSNGQEKLLPEVELWTMQQTLTNQTQPFENLDLQYYTTSVENASLNQGLLTIKALPQSTSLITDQGQRNFSYTSAKLISRAAFRYGFFVIKAKLPKGPGLWPAIWLLPFRNVCMNQVGSKYGTWAACGQIDIVQTIETNPNWLGNLYYGGEFPQVKRNLNNKLAKLDWNQWHLFGLEWTPDYTAWYLGADIDSQGQIIGGTCLQKIASDQWYSLNKCQQKFLPPAPFDQPFHLIMNLAVKDNKQNDINPACMLIDWVKVYQRANLDEQPLSQLEIRRNLISNDRIV